MRPSTSLYSVNSIGFATCYSHLIHRNNTQPHTGPRAEGVAHSTVHSGVQQGVLGTGSRAHFDAHTHMPFVSSAAPGAGLVTSSNGEFISNWSAAAWRLSKAVLSSPCLELPEPKDYLPAVGICLPPPEFAGLYHGCLPSLRGSALHTAYQCQGNHRKSTGNLALCSTVYSTLMSAAYNTTEIVLLDKSDSGYPPVKGRSYSTHVHPGEEILSGSCTKSTPPYLKYTDGVFAAYGETP